MAGSVLITQIKKEEKDVAANVTKMLDVAMKNAALLKKVDAATTSCSAGRVPPKPVLKLFEDALAKALKALKKEHPAASVTANLSYTQAKGKWRTTCTVACGLKLRNVGGGTYQVKRGDTLWAIAKAQYGAGGLWTEIANANKALVSSKGNFILAGVTLKIPKVAVPVASCNVDLVSPSARAPKDAEKPAQQICVPPYGVDFNASKPQTIVRTGPVVAWKVTFKLTGELTASCDLLLGAGLTVKAQQITVEQIVHNFIGGISIDSVGKTSVTLGSRVSGTSWTITLKEGRVGEFVGSVKSKKVEFKVGRTVLSGQIGMEVTVQALPRVRVQDLKGQVHQMWVDHGHLIKNIKLDPQVIAVGVVLIATTLTPFPGDEVVAFGAAARYAPGALRALRLAP